MSEPRFTPGQRATLTRTITEDLVEHFATLTGDTNPVHLDEAFARQTRFGRRIAHGVLGLALISAVLGTQLPGPGAIYLEQHIRFLRPVYLGDQVTAEVEVLAWDPERRRLRLQTRCLNAQGQEVMSGEALLLVEG